MEEIWKPCPEYEAYYEVSNLGRIKSKAIFIRHDGNWAEEGGYVKKIKVKNQTINRYGYLTTKLCALGKCRRLTIHRLVAKAFLPNPNKYTQVNHIDGNKHNNILTNLEWVSAKQNIQHAWETGLMNADHMQGEKHHNAKLTLDDVKAIRIYYKHGKAKTKDLALKYNVSISTVRDIINNRTWKTP